MTTLRTLLLTAFLVLLPAAAEARIIDDAPATQPSRRNVQQDARTRQDNRSLRGVTGTEYANADAAVRLWYPKGWSRVDDDNE